MRLIDADALEKTLARTGDNDKRIPKSSVLYVIRNMSTIDREILERLRPRGHYLTRTVYDSKFDERVTLYRCSECGLSDDHEHSFCPYCGADMRGETE